MTEVARRRRWPWVVAGILLLGALFVAFGVPALVAWQLRSRLRVVIRGVPYTGRADHLSFGWGKGLVVEGLRLSGPGLTLTLARLQARPRWHRLLAGELGFRPVRCLRPELTVEPAALPKPPPEPPPPPPTPPGAAEEPFPPPEKRRLAVVLPFHLREGRVRIRRAGEPDLLVTGVSADLFLIGPQGELSFRIAGTVTAGAADQRGPFSVEGGLRLLPELSGSLQVRGDARPLGRWLPPGMRAGPFRLTARLSARKGIPRVEAELELQGWEFRPGVVEPGLRVSVAAAWPPKEKMLRLEAFHVLGERLELHGAGTAGPARAALSGDLRTTLQAWQPLFPADLHAQGTVQGRFDLIREGERADLEGTITARPLRLERGQARFADPELHLALRARFRGREAEGEATLRSQNLHLRAAASLPSPPEGTVSGEVRGTVAPLLEAAGVTLPQGLRARGDLHLRFTARLGRDAPGRLGVRAAFQGQGPALENQDLQAAELRFAGEATPPAVVLHQLTCRLNGGSVQLRAAFRPGRLELAGQAEGVRITETVGRILAYAVPLYYVPPEINGEVGGKLSARVRLAGPPAWAKRAAWRGEGTLQIQEGFITGSPLVTQLLGALGKRGRYNFAAVAARFRLADGFVSHEALTVRGKDLTWGLRGRTGLDGRIDYAVPAGPLVARLYRRPLAGRPWARLLSGALEKLEALPVRLTGTLAAPRVELDLKALNGVLPGLPGGLERILGGRKKRGGR